MVPERYFRWSIWSPVLIPIIWLGTLYVARGVGMRPGVGTVASVLFMSALIGGVPYLVFAAILAWKLRRAPLIKLQRFSLLAPLAYAALLFLIVAAASLLDLSRYGILQPFVPALYYAGWAIAVGYIYVAVVHIMYFVLRWLGVFDASSRAAEQAH